MPDHRVEDGPNIHAAIPRMMLDLARLAMATERLAHAVESLARAAHVAEMWSVGAAIGQDNRLAPGAEPSVDPHSGGEP